MVYVSENKTLTILPRHKPQVSCVCAGWSYELKVSGAALVFFTLKKKKFKKNQITCFSEVFFFFFSHYFHITVDLRYCSSSLLCLICMFS